MRKVKKRNLGSYKFDPTKRKKKNKYATSRPYILSRDDIGLGSFTQSLSFFILSPVFHPPSQPLKTDKESRSLGNWKRTQLLTAETTEHISEMALISYLLAHTPSKFDITPPSCLIPHQTN